METVHILVLWVVVPILGFQDPVPPVKNVPRFEEHVVPASEFFKGTPALPHLKTPGQRKYRTMIRLTAEKGPNFAGHYAVGEWGCGTACVQMVVVDVRTGDVYEGPFGMLPEGSIYLGAGGEEERLGIFYHLNSRLFVTAGCPNYRNCGTYYYEWTGSHFKPMRKVPMKPLVGSQ